MEFPAVFLLLAAALNAVLAEVKYFKIDGELSLKPNSPSGGISSITWKHKGNIVAEWIEGSEVEYFGEFKDRTSLTSSSGVLTIRAMKKADEGNFTVEVNNRVQSVVYSAKGVKSLGSKVEVVVRPLTCNHLSPTCNFSCITHDTDVGPLRYFWKEEDGEWTEFSKDKHIINNNQIEMFFCKISNPVSEKESDPLDNPFNKHPETTGLGLGLVVGIIGLLLLGLGGGALAGFAYKYPHRVAPCIPCVAGNHTEQNTEGPLRAEDSNASVPLTDKTNP